MKNKILYAVLAIVMLFIATGCGKTNETDNTFTDECFDIVGGSFNVLFNTNGGEEIEPLNVCIACGPDEYTSLPIPIKEGYTFDGWYYDEDLTNPVTIETTLDITPIDRFDNNNCKIGYEDIKVHAKWIEN